MTRYDDLWRTILKYEDQDDLPSRAWRQLRKIASAMVELEKSGHKLYIQEKRDRLLAALGYDDENKLEQLGQIEHDLNLIEEVYKIAQEKYNGRMNPVYEKESVHLYDKATGKEKPVALGALSKRVKRAREDLGIAKFAQEDSPDKIKFEDILHYKNEKVVIKEDMLLEEDIISCDEDTTVGEDMSCRDNFDSEEELLPLIEKYINIINRKSKLTMNEILKRLNDKMKSSTK